MATVSQTITPDLIAMYTGYDQNRQAVGAGLINPNIYATPEYQEKKINSVIIGGISKVVYSAFDTDPMPTVLVVGFEPAYQTILGINLRYIPQRTRQAILKFVIDSNQARIRANQPLVIDWRSLSRVVPDVQYITRRYKVVLLGVRETVPLVEWPNIITERSPYENHYQTLKG